jgi:hypothetical protein
MRQLPQGCFLRMWDYFIRMRDILMWFEAFLKISILFEDIEDRDIVAFLINMSDFQKK